MKKIILALLLVASVILIAGCISSQHTIHMTADEYNCTIDGVTYNVTAGICHGFASTTPEITPIFTNTPTPTLTPAPKPTPQYVTCSNYHKIVDKWKTPSGEYIKTDNNETSELVPLYTFVDYYGMSRAWGDNYTAINIGEYIFINPTNGRDGVLYLSTTRDGKSIKLKPISEAESGYRDACEVIP